MTDIDWVNATDEMYMQHLAIIVVWHERWWNHYRKSGLSLCGENYAYLLGWSMDFFRALYERPRWLLRPLLGKYAYRELIGIRDVLIKNGWDVYYEYGCKRQDYHKKKVSL